MIKLNDIDSKKIVKNNLMKFSDIIKHNVIEPYKKSGTK